MQQIKLQSEKWLRLLNDGENRTDPIHLFGFLKKYEKNVHIFNNDGKHTMKIEDGASSLQLLSCNHEADSRITLHSTKSRANIVVVLKETDILMLLTYSHSACKISKECVVKYGKSSYANRSTISIWVMLSVEIYYNTMRLYVAMQLRFFLHKWKN